MPWTAAPCPSSPIGCRVERPARSSRTSARGSAALKRALRGGGSTASTPAANLAADGHDDRHGLRGPGRLRIGPPLRGVRDAPRLPLTCDAEHDDGPSVRSTGARQQLLGAQASSPPGRLPSPGRTRAPWSRTGDRAAVRQMACIGGPIEPVEVGLHSAHRITTDARPVEASSGVGTTAIFRRVGGPRDCRRGRARKYSLSLGGV